MGLTARHPTTRPAASPEMRGAIRDMKARGLTICQSIGQLARDFRLSLGDAKQIVAASPEWSELARAHEPFHDELIAAEQRDPKSRVVIKEIQK